MVRTSSVSAFAVREATKEQFNSDQKKQVVQNPEKRGKRKQKKLKVQNRNQQQQVAGTVSVSREPQSTARPGKSPLTSQRSPATQPAAKYRKLELSANGGPQQHEAVSREPVNGRYGGPAVLLRAATNGSAAGDSLKMPKSNPVGKQVIPKTGDKNNDGKKKQTSLTTTVVKNPGKQQSAAREHENSATSASPMIAASSAARKRKASPKDEDEPPKLVCAEALAEGACSSVDDCSDDGVPVVSNSEEDARNLLAALIYPVTLSTFFDRYWSKEALHVSRKNRRYYKNIFSFRTKDLDEILRTSDLQFGTNIDITSYENFKRETHNPCGRACAPVVWDMYKTGCSVRLLNPQTYHDDTWRLLSTLQELFGSGMGANVYLTPPNTQGFAPHYDDIEAFVLQLEGKKRWRIYRSRHPNEELPRFSSPNFTQEELGDPVLDCVLKRGDLLYFPRGAIHQANTVDDCHSLHITVSTHQTNTFTDLFEKMLSVALERASSSCKEFRESLPLDYLDYTGTAVKHKQSPTREKFMSKVKRLFGELKKFLPVDEACDEMGKQFIHNCLPPYVTDAEAQRSVFGSGEYWDQSSRRVRGAFELEPTTRVRLLRKHIVRMAIEPSEAPGDKLPESSDASKKNGRSKLLLGDAGKVSGDGLTVDNNEGVDNDNAVLQIYYSANNDRLPLNRKLQSIQASPKVAQVIACLIQSYPDFVAIEDFPLDDPTSIMDIMYALYDSGILLLENVEVHSSDEDDSMSETPENAGAEELDVNVGRSSDDQSDQESEEEEDEEDEEEDDEEENDGEKDEDDEEEEEDDEEDDEEDEEEEEEEGDEEEEEDSDDKATL